MVDTLVVIPTYNASKSIVKLIKQILLLSERVVVLVVDDNSPDKTAEVVQKYFFKEKRVTILNREKKGGRGSAVLDGFKKGLTQKKYQHFIEMDSDLCHDPKYIQPLLIANSFADVIIASRYDKKSRIKGWPLKRKILSRVINTILRMSLQIPIRDYTNGYRCYSRKALLSINLEAIQSKGFVMLSELAYLFYKNDCKFTEIPIIFIHQDQNKSNLNIGEMKEGMKTVTRLIFS